MKLAIKLIRHEVGYIGLILLVSVTLVFGMGARREWSAIPILSLLLGIYVYFIAQVRRDRELVIRQLTFLPDYPRIVKRIALVFASFYFCYVAVLQALLAGNTTASALNLSVLFAALAYFLIGLLIIRTRELIGGVLLAAVILLSGYWTLALLLLIPVVFSLLVTIEPQFRTISPPTETSSAISVANRTAALGITHKNYLVTYIRLMLRRTESARLDIQGFAGLLLIFAAYACNAIYQSGGFEALGYLTIFVATAFVAAFFYCLLKLQDLLPLLDFTESRPAIKTQLAPAVFCSYLGFMVILLGIGVLMVGWPHDFLAIVITLLAGLIFIETAMFLLTRFRNFKYLIIICGIEAVLLLLLTPIQQFILSGICYIAARFIHQLLNRKQPHHA